MIVLVVVMLAGVQAVDSDAVPEPPKERLVCRYDIPINPLFLRRKMCLTPTEWAKRDSQGEEASRKSIYELMGNTACLNGGLCASD